MATCRSAHASFYDPTYNTHPTDLISCGNRRSAHNAFGHCDECPACKAGVCSSQEDAQSFEGPGHYKAESKTR